MNNEHEHRSWGRFLAGVVVGAMVAMPALAAPPDLPVTFDDGLRLYVLVGSAVLLFAALVMRLMRNKDNIEVDGGAIDAPHGYGMMRFFPSDRPIPIE